MMYPTNKARETAQETISKLIVKLANTPGNDDLTLTDLMETIYYLQVMKDEIGREIKNHAK